MTLEIALALGILAGLVIERESPTLRDTNWQDTVLLELRLSDEVSTIGQVLRHREFREQYAVNLLALRNAAGIKRTRLGEHTLAADDRLLVQGDEAALERLRAATEFCDVRQVAENELREQWRLEERLFVLHIPQDGALGGSTIDDSGIGDLFDFRLLGVFRDGTLIPRTAQGKCSQEATCCWSRGGRKTSISKEWEQELADIRRDTALHESASHDYMAKSSKILERAHTAPAQFPYAESGRTGANAENAAFELLVQSRKSVGGLR
jgi:hypothetical protein